MLRVRRQGQRSAAPPGRRPQRLGLVAAAADAHPMKLDAATMEALRQARAAAVSVCTNCKINGPEYRAARALTVRIDDLVELTTGRRDTLWLKNHWKEIR